MGKIILIFGVIPFCIGLLFCFIYAASDKELRERHKAEKNAKKRNEEFAQMVKNYYEDFEQILISGSDDINFRTFCMTNEEAYKYYNNYSNPFEITKKVLENNEKIINLAHSYNYYFPIELEEKNFENLARCITMYDGTDEKNLFEEKITGYRGLVKGIDAETTMTRYLTNYFPSMHVFNSVNISFDDKKYHDFENDIISVGKNGVFTIEIKAKTYKVGKETKIIINSDGSTSENSENGLIKQSSEHAALLEIFLSKKLPDINFSNVVHDIMVITNQEVQVINQAPDLYNVVKPEGLRYVINKYPICFTDEQRERIVEVFENNENLSKKFAFIQMKTRKLRELVEKQNKIIDLLKLHNFINDTK